MFKRHKLSSAIIATTGVIVGAQPVYSQESQGMVEEVVVTGIRGSLQRALDVKRDATGVVDAISAEDIGKMPDTNLAESLQRITGVSINRVNGEGSEVTVRGFGGGFNLVTVNGRQLPSANVASVTGNPLDQGSAGTSRSFDFSNLASEGVSGIQVYKTGRAAVPTGGVGATINIDTIKPLDAGGTKVSFGIKGVEDTGGDETTPEVSGLFSWANDEGTFGVSIFGSYQERNSGSRSMSIEQYNLQTWEGDASLLAWGMQDAVVTNEPEIGQVAAIPSNIGLGVFEDERERTNGQLTLQFAPNDQMTITADATYAQNVQESVGLVDGVWLQRQFTAVEFDGNPEVATPVKLEEEIGGGGAADFFFQNLTMGVEDTLEAFGLNFDWQVRDNLRLNFDVATAEAESGPDGPFGLNSLRFNMAGATAAWRGYDFTLGIPQASIVINDSLKGNANGVFDVPDVGTQWSQEYLNQQVTETDQFRVQGTWDVKDEVTVQFGASYLGTDMNSISQRGQIGLGGWGVDNPGEIEEFAADLVTQRCTGCEFDEDLSQGVPDQGNALPAGSSTVPLGSVSFGGDSVALSQAFQDVYGYTTGDLPLDVNDNDTIEEEIWSAFVQADFDGQLAGMDTHVTVGLRYEYTDVKSNAVQTIPVEVIWLSDNDFSVVSSSDFQTISSESSYNNFLPSLDLSINFTENLKGRASFSQTLARPAYDRLFSSTGFDNPSRPVALGGTASGDRGNSALDPLESNNVDLSLEWYYGDSNLLSIGYYRKDVQNFVGTQIVEEELFGLRDATSGEPGTRSGAAIDALNAAGFPVTERNMFTMTAILDNPADFPGGAAEFNDSQILADQVFSTYDVSPNADDPLFVARVQQPVNNQTATIYGFEFVSQHFFGETGFGYQFNYTTVEGDIEFDVGADISVDQFALEGLSDSANFVFIYEKYGVSARLLYNWRDKFLSQAQRSVESDRNPEFTDAYEQWDFNLSYEINDNFSVSLDIINITEEETILFGRSRNNPQLIQELDTRYVLGLRYTM